MHETARVHQTSWRGGDGLAVLYGSGAATNAVSRLPEQRLMPALAAELVAKGVVVIAATGDVASARAAQRASSTVPVVFTIGGDPVRFGLVKSINRPGGNVTGILFNQNVLGAKRVEILREIGPNMSRVALLMNPTNPNVKVEQADAEAGAKKLGLETVTVLATNAREMNAALEQLLSAKADAFITGTDPILLDRREQIASFAYQHKLPAVGFVRQFAAVGVLSSYGPSISWMYRQAGEYVGATWRKRNTGFFAEKRISAGPGADPK